MADPKYTIETFPGAERSFATSRRREIGIGAVSTSTTINMEGVAETSCVAPESQSEISRNVPRPPETSKLEWQVASQEIAKLQAGETIR